MMTKAKHIYDVVIVGGGLSGLTLACLLGKTGMNVACIDRQDPKAAISEDLRTTAISYGSHKILDEAGIWEKLAGQTCPIQDIEIYDGASPLLLDFLSEEVKGKPFGWIVLNSDLRIAMMDTLKTLENVDHLAPVSIQGFDVADEAASVRLENGQLIKTQLVIGADGRQSSVRDFMDVPVRGKDYKQRAIVSVVAHENPHKNVAVEHFWPEGPFAVLPMADDEKGNHRSAVVFTEHGSDRQSWMALTDEAFEIALAARFPERYGAVQLQNKRAAYPLNLTHASTYIGPRMALVADAAHGIHPIAGQGLNLGFRDVDVMSGLLGARYQKGGDLGASDLLKSYERARRLDNMAMVAFTDALVQLFSNDVPPVRLLRRAGMKLVSRIPPAKRFFMRKAMGE